MSAAIVSLLIAATLPGLRAARLVAQELACMRFDIASRTQIDS